MVIRECLLEDCASISLLNKNEMCYDYPAEDVKKQLKKLLKEKQHKIYVALADSKIVGYVHANDYDLLYAPHFKNIMGIAVASGYRKNGIGTMLLLKIEQWAKDTNACGVRLVSGSARADAHAFYRACGYSSCKDQKNFKKVFDTSAK
ncbi:MAG: GNAT family N-acetyltransferase [Bacillota bacterium]|nr:GNAT family N-acetyltransferase [Bacillota bacterium]